jgi:glycerol-3-phosphate cytidylyltransferase
VARYRDIQHKYAIDQEVIKMIVYTVGTFDLLHVGHLALLEYCRTLGDVVAVGVASDSVVNSYKPNKPVIPLDQRAEMLRALRCVDIVRTYHELEYVSACKELNVDIFVIGEDWGNKPHNLAVEAYLRSEDKSICQIRYSPRTSSTGIKQCAIAQFRRGEHLHQTLHRRAVVADQRDLVSLSTSDQAG